MSHWWWWVRSTSGESARFPRTIVLTPTERLIDLEAEYLARLPPALVDFWVLDLPSALGRKPTVKELPGIAAGWGDGLEGWGYRKSHVVVHAAGAGTLYQVKLTVHYGAGSDSGGDVYLNSHSRTDFGDVRFTGSDKTSLLDYWIETKVDGDYATFWVEVAEDLSTVDRTIYIYYGKSDATTTKNGDATFLQFDDFEDDTVGQIPSGWAETENPANGSCLTTASGFLGKGVEIISTAITYRAVKTFGTALSGSYVVEARYKGSVNNGEYVLMDATGSYHLAIRKEATKADFRVLRQADVWGPSGLAKDTSWHKVKFFVKEAADSFVVFIDTTQVTGQIYGTGTSSGSWGCRFQQTGTIVLDEMFARKYTDPEPTHGSWGSEEEPTAEVNLVEYEAEARLAGKGEAWVLDLPDALGRKSQAGEGPTAEFDSALGRKPQLGSFWVLDLPAALGRVPASGEFDALDLPAALGRKPEALIELWTYEPYSSRAVESDVSQDLDCVGDLYVYGKEAKKPQGAVDVVDCGVDKPEVSVFVRTHHLRPTDDCCVCDDFPDTNFDGDPSRQLSVNSPPSGNRWSYLRFDVSGYTPISLAKLRLYVWSDYGFGVTHTYTAFKVSSDTWEEETITWNNKPAVGDAIASAQKAGGGWVEIDVTSYIEAERTLDGKASLCVKIGTLWAIFYDVENGGDYKPELYLEYA